MYFCDGCRVRQEMPAARVICGPFAWRLYFCTKCRQAKFDSKWQRLGYLLTIWMSTGEMLITTNGGQDYARE